MADNNFICIDNKSIPENVILGNLLFYSVDDILISDKDLRDIFIKSGVPTSYIGQIHPSDVFRRATSAFKYTKVPEGKIEVDEVVCDDDKIKRILGVKQVNKQQEDIGYTPVMAVEYDRASESISTYYCGAFTASNNPELEKVRVAMEDKFNEWKVYHTKDTVRNLFNKIINSTHPVTLVPGGLCKFIPKAHKQLLYALKESLEYLSAFNTSQNSKGNYMEIIPVINTFEQQELIKTASEAEIKANLASFLSEIREAVQNKGTLTPRSVKAYMARFKEMQTQINEYETLLGNYMDVLKVGIATALNNMNAEDYSSI